MQVTADPWGPFNEVERTWNAGPACNTSSTPPRPDPPPEVINPGSPIVFSLSGGYRLSGADDPVRFDIDADGSLDRVTWTARGSDEAFLALDRDGDGLIRDGRELFGNATLTSGGATAENGFEALKEFDASGDGRIDPRDPIWGHLLLWLDRDHDGVSASSELTALAGSGVSGISLDYRWTGHRDRHRNQFRYASAVDTLPGSRVHRHAYDIYFVVLR